MGATAFKNHGSSGTDSWELPEVLIVESPNGQQACAGKYELVPEVLANGQPVWRKPGDSTTGDRWLYSSNRGTWNIGGKKAMDKDFKCHDAHIYRPALHKGLLPHQVGGVWQWTDGKAFHKDADICVKDLLPIEVEADPMEAESDFGGGWFSRFDNFYFCPVSASVRNEKPVMLLSAGLHERAGKEYAQTDDQSDEDFSPSSAKKEIVLANPTQKRCHAEPKSLLPRAGRDAATRAPAPCSWQSAESPFLEDCTPKNHAAAGDGDSIADGMVDPKELRRCLMRVAAERKGTSWAARRFTGRSRYQDPMSPEELEERGGRAPARSERAVGAKRGRVAAANTMESDDEQNLEPNPAKVAQLEITCSLSARSNSKPVQFVFPTRPLGFEFDSKMPMTIRRVSKACAAAHPGMKTGLTINAINGRDVTKLTFAEASALLKDTASQLPSV